MRSMFFGLALAALALGGCGEANFKTHKKVVAIDTVPELVMQAAQKARPDIKFDTANRGEGFYEVRGKAGNGKIVEVEVSDAGEILEIE